MKVITLLENTARKETLCRAHGLSLYLETPEHKILCDMGPNAGFLENAQALGVDIAAVDIAFLSHGHYDHTGAVAALREKWPDIPVYLNHKDQYTDDAYAMQLFPTIPDTVDYGEGDTLTVGTLTVSVLATPGHSEGSVTLRCGDVLFCGDTLFAGSCGRTDFLGGSMTTILASLRRLGRLEGNLKVLPGHMEPSDLDSERKWNPYLMQALRA